MFCLGINKSVSALQILTPRFSFKVSNIRQKREKLADFQVARVEIEFNTPKTNYKIIRPDFGIFFLSRGWIAM